MGIKLLLAIYAAKVMAKAAVAFWDMVLGTPAKKYKKNQTIPKLCCGENGELKFL